MIHSTQWHQFSPFHMFARMGDEQMEVKKDCIRGTSFWTLYFSRLISLCSVAQQYKIRNNKILITYAVLRFCLYL